MNRILILCAQPCYEQSRTNQVLVDATILDNDFEQVELLRKTGLKVYCGDGDKYKTSP